MNVIVMMKSGEAVIVGIFSGLNLMWRSGINHSSVPLRSALKFQSLSENLHPPSMIFIPQARFLSIHLSLYLSIYLSIYVSIYLSIYLCIYQSIYPSTYFFTNLSLSFSASTYKSSARSIQFLLSSRMLRHTEE